MFRFYIEFIDEDDHLLKNEKGIVKGGNYTKAVNRLMKYYKPSTIVSFNLYELEDVILDTEMQSMMQQAS